MSKKRKKLRNKILTDYFKTRIRTILYILIKSYNYTNKIQRICIHIYIYTEIHIYTYIYKILELTMMMARYCVVKPE